MSLTEVMPGVERLSRIEKFQLIQLLANQLEQQETEKVLCQPDWKTGSDAEFAKAAKEVFEKNAPLLRRLA